MIFGWNFVTTHSAHLVCSVLVCFHISASTCDATSKLILVLVFFFPMQIPEMLYLRSSQ